MKKKEVVVKPAPREVRDRATNPLDGEQTTTLNTSPKPPKVAEAVEDAQGKQDIQNANDDRKAENAGVVEVVKGPGAGTGPGGSAP